MVSPGDQRRRRGETLDLEQLRAIKKFLDADKYERPECEARIKTLRISEEILQKHTENPERLAKRIKELENGDGKARALKKKARQVFVEGVRVLSTTVDDLSAYIPALFMRTECSFMQRSRTGAFQRRVSKATLKHEAMLCFDTSGTMTIAGLKEDATLKRICEENLVSWVPGTVGVHAVDIVWQLAHQGDRSRAKGAPKGGKMTLLVMVERCLGPGKALAVSLVSPNASDVEKAETVKNLLVHLPTTKVVRLTSETRGDEIVPTAVGKATLEKVLGDSLRVELDQPTRGLGAIRVKGRFDSPNHLFDGLCEVMGLEKPVPVVV